jgi:hypothetical protein
MVANGMTTEQYPFPCTLRPIVPLCASVAVSRVACINDARTLSGKLKNPKDQRDKEQWIRAI